MSDNFFVLSVSVRNIYIYLKLVVHYIISTASKKVQRRFGMELAVSWSFLFVSCPY